MGTTGDVVEKVVLKGEDSSRTSLKSIMTFPLVTISFNGTVKQALQLMRLNRIKRVPVTNSTGIIGIVTQRSLADAVSKSVLERTLDRAKSTLKMRYKPVLGNLGVLLQFSAVLLVVPALVGTALGQANSITGVYLEVVGLSFTGFFLMAYGEKGQMNLKQASIFIVASFVVMSLFGSLPYVYLNPFARGIDANSLFVNSLFESASGFTITGLSMITHQENLPQSFNFYRSYTQWVVGLPFVYLVMILFFPKEKLSAWKSVLGGGTLKFKEFIVTLVGIFSAYLVILVLLLVLGGADVIYSVSVVMAALTSGGFAPMSDFVLPAHPEYLLIIGAGMILSALPFAFHYYIFSRRGLINKKTLGPEVIAYLVLMTASVPIFFALAGSASGLDWGSAAFHIVSTSSTTGFQYINIHSIAPAAKIFMVVLMLIGGAAFSTAGGIKVGRFVILYQEFAKRIGTKKSEMHQSSPSDEAYSSISSTANPHRSKDNGILERIREEYRTRDFREIMQKQGELLQVMREILGIKLVREILIVIGLYIGLSILTGSILSNTSGSSFEDGLFESVSALSNTGLSAGITSLALDSFSKLVLIANMIAGRFEIIAIFYIFFSSLRK